MNRGITTADRLGTIRVWMDANGVDVLALGDCDFGPLWLSGGAGIAVIAASNAETGGSGPSFVADVIKPGGGFAAHNVPVELLESFCLAVVQAGGEVLDLPATTWKSLAQACNGV